MLKFIVGLWAILSKIWTSQVRDTFFFLFLKIRRLKKNSEYFYCITEEINEMGGCCVDYRLF